MAGGKRKRPSKQTFRPRKMAKRAPRVTKKKKKRAAPTSQKAQRERPFREPAMAPSVPFVGTEAGSLLPKKKRVKMTYGFNVVASTVLGGGGYAIQAMRASSIYDPDLTGTGEQPYTHDQWAQFFTRYRVLGARLNCKIVSMSAINTDPLKNRLSVVGTNVRNASQSAITTVKEYLEQPQAQADTLGNYLGHGAEREFVRTYSWRNWFSQAEANGLVSDFHDNPAENIVFDMFVYNGGTDAQDYAFIGTLEYIVELTEPIRPGPS